MTVCYTKIPFPIPSGLLQRPVITAYAGETDLTPYDITYKVTGSDDQGEPTCCNGVESIVWPSSSRIGALHPVEEGEYEFTAMVDTGVDGIVKLTPAKLTVTGVMCSQVECEPCGLDDCPPCGEYADITAYVYYSYYYNTYGTVYDIDPSKLVVEYEWAELTYAPPRVAIELPDGSWLQPSQIISFTVSQDPGYTYVVTKLTDGLNELDGTATGVFDIEPVDAYSELSGVMHIAIVADLGGGEITLPTVTIKKRGWA